MNHKANRSGKSILNWLGLGVLALIVVALIQLSGEADPMATPNASEAPVPTAIGPSSPLSVALLSPVPANPIPPGPENASPAAPASLNSPLPSASTVGPSLDAAPADSFRLTVLHTNDTWGYLLPCG